MFKVSCSVVFLSLIVGCASAPTQKFTFAPVMPAQGMHQAFIGEKPSLTIDKVRAFAGFTSDGMAYQDTKNTLAYFQKSVWVDTPARLLQPLFVQYMEHADVFSAVIAAPDQTTTDYRMEVDLVKLVQVFGSGNDSHIELSLRVRLVDFVSGQLLFARLYEANLPASSRNAEGGVMVVNQALEKILMQVQKDVKQVLKRQKR